MDSTQIMHLTQRGNGFCWHLKVMNYTKWLFTWSGKHLFSQFLSQNIEYTTHKMLWVFQILGKNLWKMSKKVPATVISWHLGTDGNFFISNNVLKPKLATVVGTPQQNVSISCHVDCIYSSSYSSISVSLWHFLSEASTWPDTIDGCQNVNSMMKTTVSIETVIEADHLVVDSWTGHLLWFWQL